MATPNLDIPELTAAQGQKEVSWNWGLRLLEMALTEPLTVSLASGNASLTLTQVRRSAVLRLTSATVVGRTVTLPAVKRLLFVDASAAAEDVDLVVGSTVETVAAGAGAIIYLDGTANGMLFFVDPGLVPPTAFNALLDVSGDYPGNAGRAPFVGATEAGMEIALPLPTVGASPVGAWEFLGSQDLAANSDITTLGDSGIIELMILLVDLAPTTTDGNVFARFRVGGTYQSGAGVYAFVNHAVSSAGGEATLGNTGSALDLTRFAAGGRLINSGDSTSGCSGVIRLSRPHDTCLHRTRHRFTFQGTANVQWTHGSGVYTGGTGAVTGIRIGHSSGGIGRGTALVFGLRGTVSPRRPIDPWFHKPGMPGSSELLLSYTATRRVVLPAGLTGSRGSAGTASTGTADLDVLANGVSVGTVTFTASSTATFAMATETVLEAGDVLTVVAPGSADATLADVSVTFAGTTDA